MVAIAALLQNGVKCHQAGQLAQAEGCYRQVLQQQPQHVEALFRLAALAHECGHVEAALRLAIKAQSIDRRAARVLALLGDIHTTLGGLDLAVKFYRKALKIDPGYAQVLNRLGGVMRRQGKLDKAKYYYQQAIAKQDDYFVAYNNLGLLLKESGQFDEAVKVLAKGGEINPRSVELAVNLALTYESMGQLLAAQDCYQRALALSPESLDILSGIAQLYRNMREYDKSLLFYLRACDLSAHNAELHSNVGHIYQLLGCYQEAADAYRKAIELDPLIIDIYNNLGVLERQFGHFDLAIDNFRQMLVIDPFCTDAYRQIANTRRFIDEGDDRLALMLAAVNRQDFSAMQKMHLYFGLARAYDDLGQNDRSFDYLEKGNQVKRASFDYDVLRKPRQHERVKKLFSEEFFLGNGRKLKNIDGVVRPVFIVGMPRSGTSLVEQILSSHAQVFGAGELKDISSLLQGGEKGALEFPASIAGMDDDQLRHLGDEYLVRVAGYADGERYVVDKLPANFLFVGVIKKMFADAIVIHCRRNPVDTCLSCYQQYFTDGQLFSFELSELGHYYNLYEEMMAHWHAVLPGFVHDIFYENIISDQEAQTRKLLDVCGLPWDPACLDFHKTERAVRTASVTQVRQPLYSTSVKKWRAYEHRLTPLLAVLRSR